MKKSAVSKKKQVTKPKRVAKATRLLSGGNPQIAKGDGERPVRSYIASMPDWKRKVGERLDQLISKSLPDVNKAVKWNSPFYGTEACGWLFSFHCFTKYVKVTFFNGAKLDPQPPGSSKHAAVRYLDIFEDDDIDEKQFIKWVKQAAKWEGWRAGL